MKKIIIFFCLVSLFIMNSIVCANMTNKWQNIEGSYTKENGNQYNNGTIQFKILDNDTILFELKALEGSEDAEKATDFTMTGSFFINSRGIGQYEGLNEDKLVKLLFNIDGDVISIVQEGNLPVNVSGRYKFAEHKLNLSENAVTELIESLPSAATSLNAINRPYTLQYTKEPIDNWFYEVNAIYNPTQKVISSFFVAADLSAVYRFDGEGDPILIYGNDNNMINTKVILAAKVKSKI